VFGASFGEDEGAVGEVEGGEIISAAEFGSSGTPVEAAGDHEMKDEPDAVVELDGDAFADSAKPSDGVAFDLFDPWVNGAKEEGTGDADVGEGLVEDAELKGGEVGRDVRELWHVVGEMITAAGSLDAVVLHYDAVHLRIKYIDFDLSSVSVSSFHPKGEAYGT
jgi:hypothetical protein